MSSEIEVVGTYTDSEGHESDAGKQKYHPLALFSETINSWPPLVDSKGSSLRAKINEKYF